MAALTITDFRYGMDRRRKRVAGVPGTLWLGKNCHISRGGDIERAKKFADTYDLSALGTFGLCAVNQQIFVFGSGERSLDLPLAIGYQQLVAPNAEAMTAILDAKPIDGKIYAIAQYADGNVYHFYDGDRVTDWDTLALEGGSLDTVAAALAEAISADLNVDATSAGPVITITGVNSETTFTTAAYAVNGGAISDESTTVGTVQAAAPATPYVPGFYTIQITGGTSNPGTNRIRIVGLYAAGFPAAPYAATLNVNWQTSNSDTAIALAAAINANIPSLGTATAQSDTVTIAATAAAADLDLNSPLNYSFGATLGGDVTVTLGQLSGTAAATDAQPQIDNVTLAGTYEPGDRWVVSINGTEYSVQGTTLSTGSAIFANRKRAWSPVDSLMRYSKVATPTDWTDANAASGAGFINIASDSGGADRLKGQARYNSLTAIFSDQNIYLYNIGTDAEEFSIADTLENTGTRSSRAILSFGNVDVFYLDRSGIRSLRARTGTDTAVSDDIGTLIDTFLLEYVDTLAESVVERAIFVMEPRDGRLWCIIGARIFVYTNFRQSKINSWTYYEPESGGTALSISDVARIGQRLYVRAQNDHIYLYGGATGNEYPADDEMPAVVQLPFLTAQAPATAKQMTGWDIACTNRWTAEILVDPNDETKVINAGTLTETNYHKPAATYPGLTSHMAMNLTCSRGGEASISMISLHYEPVEAR
jgi:hypothetical protein